MKNERRGSRRRPLEFPLSLLGTKGKTRNISSTGVLIEVPSGQAIGSEIEFSLAGLSVHGSGVRCRATVVRIDDGHEHALIAARLDDVEFESRLTSVN